MSSNYIRTFDGLNEDIPARYAKHDVLDLDSKLQWLGMDLSLVKAAHEVPHQFQRSGRRAGKAEKPAKKSTPPIPW